MRGTRGGQSRPPVHNSAYIPRHSSAKGQVEPIPITPDTRGTDDDLFEADAAETVENQGPVVVDNSSEVQLRKSERVNEHFVGVIPGLIVGMKLTLFRAEQDDKEAIDKSNIIEERTRGAKPEGSYKEPGDKEGLPENDGTSAIGQ